jgi:type III pantothenate kinase
MNILAIDIGNTRISLGACVGGKVVGVERFDASEAAAKAGPAGQKLAELLHDRPAPRIVVCSVNAELAERVLSAVQAALDWPVLTIGKEIELPLELDVDAATVGADRVVAAAAAFEAVGGPGQPVVVASLGTALTVNAVSSAGRFLGGVICPGLRLSARILHEGTAALPLVEPATPPGPFGKNTGDAIAAGLFYAAGGTIREVVERMAAEFGAWPHLVLTGGDAELVAPAYEFVDSVVPNLTLLGVNLAFRKHVEAHGGKR